MRMILLATVISFFFAGCGKEQECPACRPDESCLEGACAPQGGTFYFGGKNISSSNLFWGVVGGSICPDTILLSVNADTLPPYKRFSLFVKFPPLLGGVQNIRPILAGGDLDSGYRLEPIMDPSLRFCRQGTDNYYASAWFKINGETADMKLYFWLVEDIVPELVDSTSLTLHKR